MLNKFTLKLFEMQEIRTKWDDLRRIEMDNEIWHDQKNMVLLSKGRSKFLKPTDELLKKHNIGFLTPADDIGINGIGYDEITEAEHVGK